MAVDDLEFREFFASQFGQLYWLGLLLTGNPGQAEELAQDSMVRTYNRWALVRKPNDPALYARRVLVNRHRSLLRRALVGAPPGDSFRPVGPAALIRGVHQGFRWQFIVVMGVDQHGQRLGLCYLREDRPGSGVGGRTCGWSRNPAERAPPWLDDTGRAGIFEYWGAAPKATARVRLEPLGKRRPAPVVVDAIDPGPAFPFRVYVGFAPPQLGVVRAVALDATGRELGRSRDPVVSPAGLAPTDAPVLVATQTSATGTRKLYAYHAHQYSCVRLVDVDGREEECWLFVRRVGGRPRSFRPRFDASKRPCRPP